MKTKFLILFLLCLFMCFCRSCNCNDDMNDIRNQYGEAEEKQTYSSSDYYSETWWYWTKGISYTFAWGSSVKGGCEVSKYTFEPIPLNSSKEKKLEITKSKKLSEYYFNVCKGF